MATGRYYKVGIIKIKNIKCKSSENIQKKRGGPDRSVSDNQSSSVTLNELAMKARRKNVLLFRFKVKVNLKVTWASLFFLFLNIFQVISQHCLEGSSCYKVLPLRGTSKALQANS